MKKIIFSIIFFVSLLSYSEVINTIEAKVSLNKDGSVHIIKEIDYNPENNDVHGIIVDIINKNSSFKFFKFENKLGIKNFKANFPYVKKKQGSYYSYRLGDSNYYLQNNNITKFIIEYDLYNIVRTDEKNTQIYLNIIGNFWEIGIENVAIELDFDKEAINDLYVFTGSYGDNTNNYYLDGNIIRNKEPLGKNNGITFKLNLDNKIYPYTQKDKINNILITYNSIKYNVIISIIMIILLILTIIKRIKIKNSRPIITPEFSIDKRVSPALSQKIYNNVKNNQLTVIFLSLVSKGFIEEKEGFKDKYKLVSDDNKIKEALNSDEILLEEEKLVLKSFYKYKDDVFKNIKNTSNINYKVKNLISRIFNKNIGYYNIIYLASSAILLIILLVINILLFGIELNTFIFPFIIGILIILLSDNMLIIKKEGISAYASVYGFVMYFNLVETNVFKTLKTKEEIIKYAKEMLPYAVALGIEAKFINDLNKELSYRNIDVNNIYPYMYYNYYINSRYINNKINEDISKNAKLENAKSSHSSGGGFSSGSGGFSGGGFSGGGGRSW